jgi:hypothetical protein
LVLTPKRTGFGQHGDYVFGWEGDTLQRAMDNSCFGPTCPKGNLKTQTFAAANKCTVKNAVHEEYDACKSLCPRKFESSWLIR